MDNQLMSSEDSAEEDDVKVLRKRPLQCRSTKVDAFFVKLDALVAAEKKGRFAIRRTTGSPSGRTIELGKFPAWAVTQ